MSESTLLNGLVYSEKEQDTLKWTTTIVLEGIAVGEAESSQLLDAMINDLQKDNEKAKEEAKEALDK
ncbi:hypothetical protein [Alteribacter aurantiacus]|uniref:hypothetical protein n=1 Tax=Alteribacter aurantiacus TaxID=254410 RepID=UPI000427B3CE|nr:hypothetical protein [Alteribacter aurantiacus]